MTPSVSACLKKSEDVTTKRVRTFFQLLISVLLDVAVKRDVISITYQTDSNITMRPFWKRVLTCHRKTQAVRTW
jgi:hypothetical protein